jgi:hypothetical protein
MIKVGSYIGRGKASGPREGLIPNPKLKLLEQVSEVMRFKAAVDGMRAVAGEGCGFCAEPGHGARGERIRGSGKHAAGEPEGALGGPPEAGEAAA